MRRRAIGGKRMVHRGDALEGVGDHHGHDHHAENLHATTTHPHHHHVHGQSLRRRHGELPRLGLLNARCLHDTDFFRAAMLVLGHGFRIHVSNQRIRYSGQLCDAGLDAVVPDRP